MAEAKSLVTSSLCSNVNTKCAHMAKTIQPTRCLPPGAFTDLQESKSAFGMAACGRSKGMSEGPPAWEQPPSRRRGQGIKKLSSLDTDEC